MSKVGISFLLLVSVCLTVRAAPLTDQLKGTMFERGKIDTVEQMATKELEDSFSHIVEHLDVSALFKGIPKDQTNLDSVAIISKRRKADTVKRTILIDLEEGTLDVIKGSEIGKLLFKPDSFSNPLEHPVGEATSQELSAETVVTEDSH